MTLEEQVRSTGLIPVAAFDRPEDGPRAAAAIARGGIDLMEITLRTPAALKAIAAVRERCPEVTVGAGTILTLDQAKDAVAAGASFLVSPGFDEGVCAWSLKQGIPVFPGCVTPTEIQRGLALGLKTFKFFPASVYGGLKACKALYGPFQSAGVSFIPTGGIDLTNLAEYAAAPYIAAIGGGWLCDGKAIKAGDFDKLTETARRSVAVLLGFSFAHLGVNAGTDTAAGEMDDLRALVDLSDGGGNPNFMLDSAMEICRTPAPGAFGHIAVKTNSILRAARYLEKRGVEFDWENAKRKGDRLVALYCKKQYGGFAVHLLQK